MGERKGQVVRQGLRAEQFIQQGRFTRKTWHLVLSLQDALELAFEGGCGVALDLPDFWIDGFHSLLRTSVSGLAGITAHRSRAIPECHDRKREMPAISRDLP
jgi:hypothetical protein